MDDAAPPTNRQTITIDCDDPELSVYVLGDTIATSVRRLNVGREQHRLGCVVVRRVVIELEKVVLTDADVATLTTARSIIPMDSPTFADASEVRQFFTHDIIEFLVPNSRLSATELRAMADVVIKSRHHCDF